MDHRVFKLYNQRDFDKITKGIKVAKCMRTRSSNGTKIILFYLSIFVNFIYTTFFSIYKKIKL